MLQRSPIPDDKSKTMIMKQGIRRKFIPYLFFAALLLPAACTSIDCPVQNAVYTIYKVYDSNGNPVALMDTLTISTTRSDGNDSVLLNRSVNTSSFNLPISYTSPADTLIFEFKNEDASVTDRVIVSKEDTPHFESVDCNLSYFHTITGVQWTRNVIDSIAINNQSVNYDLSKEHFHIYFRTNP